PLAVHRHLALLHALQERALGPGRAAVDLIRQDHVGKDRTGAKLKLLLLLIVDGYPDDVRRQEVGRKLDATESEAHRLGQSAGEHRLAHPGYVLSQNVSLAEERAERLGDGALLADQH